MKNYLALTAFIITAAANLAAMQQQNSENKYITQEINQSGEDVYVTVRIDPMRASLPGVDPSDRPAPDYDPLPDVQVHNYTIPASPTHHTIPILLNPYSDGNIIEVRLPRSGTSRTFYDDQDLALQDGTTLTIKSNKDIEIS